MLKDVDESEAREVHALLTTLDKIKPWLKAITSEVPSRAGKSAFTVSLPPTTVTHICTG